MLFAKKLKYYIFNTKTGKAIGGAYAIYLLVLMISSAQIGLQLGSELKTIPAQDRMSYISSYLSNKF